MDRGLELCTGGSDPNHTQEKEMHQGKWLSEEAFKIAEKRREAKGKGEKERYTHLNAEFQRLARRDKAFLSDQVKEIEENNRMGKTRDLVKKIRDTKGTFYAKMGTIKDRNGMDLTRAEDIKKRWQEYTEELYKKKTKIMASCHITSREIDEESHHHGYLGHEDLFCVVLLCILVTSS